MAGLLGVSDERVTDDPVRFERVDLRPGQAELAQGAPRCAHRAAARAVWWSRSGPRENRIGSVL